MKKLTVAERRERELKVFEKLMNKTEDAKI